MNEKNKESIDSYLNTYYDIKKQIQIPLSNELIKIIALLYNISNKPFQVELFEEIGERINKKIGYSSNAGEMPYVMGTILNIKYEYPFTEINRLLHIIKIIEQYELYKDYSLFIACILLDEDNIKDRLEKSRNTFYNMQDRHSFITGEDDFTFSILLSELSKDTNALMDDVEYYYRALAKDCFKRGNSLQLLSHVVTLMENDNKDKAIENCIYIYKVMKQHRMKIKDIIYALIGVMSTVMEEQQELIIVEIKEVMEYLNNTKLFKKSKEFNCIMGIFTVIKLQEYDSKGLYHIGNTSKKTISYSLLIAILSNLLPINH
ncbi:MAG: DUF4003 domain-containing protein [Vallitalea sp.]|jgi:hypothetical protein|nr:DUF4003 domain-containing protein [Vallitalea sp.]